VLDRTCEHCGDPAHGRPRLVPGLVQFSVSRSEGHAAVAVASAPVGVDVEDADRSVSADEIAPVLAPDEREWLSGRGDDAALQLWVLKEAVGKAMGLGIVGAERFSVLAGERDLTGWQAVVDPAGRPWSVRLVDAADAIAAVAVAGPPRPIRGEPQ
jgi:phosphopantetheinyl transferase